LKKADLCGRRPHAGFKSGGDAVKLSKWLFLFSMTVLLLACAAACAPHHRGGANATDDDSGDDDNDLSPDDDDDNDDLSPLADDDDDDDNDNDDDDDFVWTAMTGNLPSLYAVWGTSHDDVFAAGYDFYSESGAVVHYDGVAWERMNVEMPEQKIYAIWGASTSDVYVGLGGQDGGVWHYNGSSWSEMFSQGIEIAGIWGASPSDVYATGAILGPQSYHLDFLLRYGGSGWSPEFITEVMFGAVWGTSASDVFVVTSGTDASILHFDGSHWRPMLSQGGAAIIGGFWGPSPSDVFAAAGNIVEGTAVIFHYDGASWTESDMGDVPGLNRMWGAAHNDIYAVGASISTGVVVHYDGSSWREMGGGPFLPLYDIWGAGSGDVFAVGIENSANGGVIYHYGPPA
jgi:hypothetical protein